MFTSKQFSLVVGAKVPRSWAGVRFYKSVRSGGYCLWGFPIKQLPSVLERLAAQGAPLAVSGVCKCSEHHGWAYFSASPELAAKLALWFPAPIGATPLLITGKGTLGKRRGARVLVQPAA